MLKKIVVLASIAVVVAGCHKPEVDTPAPSPTTVEELPIETPVPNVGPNVSSSMKFDPSPAPKPKPSH